MVAVGVYVTYQLNLWGPILKMTEAASQQALEEGKRRLREFLESSDTGRQAIAMSASDRAGPSGGHKEEYEMSDMPKRGSNSNDDLDDL